KVDELSRSNNDMKNLLNSTDIATLFLDSELLVRRFTTQTTKIIKLIPADTGRPITDIASDLDYPGLADDSREVLRTLVFKDRDVPARDGRWFNVRILPYRTLENVIDGVVITFTEVTAAKTLETTLREQAGQLKHMTESLPNLVWTCRPDGSCESLSQQWLQHTGVPEARQVGWGWLEQVHRDERDVVRSMWKNASRTGQQFESEFRIHGKDDSYRWFKTIAVPVRDPQGKLLKWYCTCIDVDDLKRAAEERSRAAERIGGILEAIDDAFISLDEELRVTYFNAVAERLFARKRADVLGKSLFDAFPTAGAPLETKLREAMRARSAASFEGELTRGARFALRVFPHAGGVSMFCRPGSTIGA
ncbi:MAG TPA: PAS domain-containing protein, partial [Polyangiaceae bacterium]